MKVLVGRGKGDGEDAGGWVFEINEVEKFSSGVGVEYVPQREGVCLQETKTVAAIKNMAKERLTRGFRPRNYNRVEQAHRHAEMVNYGGPLSRDLIQIAGAFGGFQRRCSAFQEATIFDAITTGSPAAENEGK